MPDAGDDIENIYRDFADNYSFKPQDNGWDSMMQKLDNARPAVQPPETGGTAPTGTGILRLYKYFLPGAAAILVTAVVLIYKHTSPGTGNANKAGNALVKTKLRAGAAQNAKAQSTPFDTLLNKNMANKAGNNIAANNTTNNNNIADSNNTKNTVSDINSVLANTIAFLPGKKDAALTTVDANAVIKTTAQQPLTAKQAVVTGSLQTQATAQSSTVQQADEHNAAQQIKNILLHGEIVPVRDNSLIKAQPVVPQQLPAATTHTTELPDGFTSGVSAPVRVQTQPPAYFFAGLTAGPDVSTVQNSGKEKTGLSIGLTAGVQVTKQFAVKTGLLFESKNYYSPGRLFWHNDIPPPNQNFLASVNMHSRLVEVPVTVQYNFVQKRKFSLFVAPGFSSYFINNEKYEMVFRTFFGEEKRMLVSQQSYADIFSIFHLSGGLQYKFSNTASVTLEPYLKLPLTGIGKGSLPVTSSGIYVSIVYSFLHK